MNKGFTILEVLLSLILISVIAGISVPIYNSFQIKNNLDVASNTVIQTLRRAQILSQAVDGDTSWGVKISDENVTLFRGTSFFGRDIGFEEEFGIPAITNSGLQEIVFDKFSGNPQSSGTIILTSVSGEVRQITINEKGTIDY